MKRISFSPISNLIFNFAFFLLLALTSCTVGPDYSRPHIDTPSNFKSAVEQEKARPHLDTNWWLIFEDSDLNSLEQSLLATNQDIKAAMARVGEARQTALQVKSQFYPTITLDPNAQRARTPFQNSNGSSAGEVTANNFQIPFDLNYEIDIWGAVRRTYEAARSQTQATVDDFAVVLQTAEADLAEYYFNLRSFENQDRILQDSVNLYRRQIDLTQTQFKVGLVSRTDVLQAQTQLDATITQELEVRRQRIDTEHAIAILIGKPPAEFSILAKPVEAKIPKVPAGLPSDLLLRRPDVAEAEQNLVSANAQIGVAVSNFYPTVNLTSTAGFESIDIQHVLDWQDRIWSIGTNLTQPIFEGGKLRAELEQAKERYKELLATYRTAVLGAYRDVEDSLTDLHMRADEAEAQKRAVNESREYLRLTNIQYTQGLVNYLQIIDAERTLLSNQLTDAQILNERQVSTVLLIKALGGGWDLNQAQNYLNRYQPTMEKSPYHEKTPLIY